MKIGFNRSEKQIEIIVPMNGKVKWLIVGIHRVKCETD